MVTSPPPRPSLVRAPLLPVHTARPRSSLLTDETSVHATASPLCCSLSSKPCSSPYPRSHPQSSKNHGYQSCHAQPFLLHPRPSIPATIILLAPARGARTSTLSALQAVRPGPCAPSTLSPPPLLHPSKPLVAFTSPHRLRCRRARPGRPRASAASTATLAARAAHTATSVFAQLRNHCDLRHPHRRRSGWNAARARPDRPAQAPPPALVRGRVTAPGRAPPAAASSCPSAPPSHRPPSPPVSSLPHQHPTTSYLAQLPHLPPPPAPPLCIASRPRTRLAAVPRRHPSCALGCAGPA